MIERLTSQLGRKDQEPNIELAQALCQDEDADGIREIVAGLLGKDKAIANDCIKVCRHVADAMLELRAPELLAARM